MPSLRAMTTSESPRPLVSLGAAFQNAPVGQPHREL